MKILFIFLSLLSFSAHSIVVVPAIIPLHSRPTKPKNSIKPMTEVYSDGFVICGADSFNEKASGDGCKIKDSKSSDCIICRDEDYKWPILSFRDYLVKRKGSNVEYRGISPYLNSEGALRVIIYYTIKQKE